MSEGMEGSIDITQPREYQLDVNKIQSLEDVKVVISLLGITVQEHSEAFEKLQGYLKEQPE